MPWSRRCWAAVPSSGSSSGRWSVPSGGDADGLEQVPVAGDAPWDGEVTPVVVTVAEASCEV